jgi:hypothetical protein
MSTFRSNMFFSRCSIDSILVKKCCLFPKIEKNAAEIKENDTVLPNMVSGVGVIWLLVSLCHTISRVPGPSCPPDVCLFQ